MVSAVVSVVVEYRALGQTAQKCRISAPHWAQLPVTRHRHQVTDVILPKTPCTELGRLTEHSRAVQRLAAGRFAQVRDRGGARH